MIKWRNEIFVGGGVIDTDHRYLIDIIKAFERKIGKFLAAKRLDREDVLIQVKVPSSAQR